MGSLVIAVMSFFFPGLGAGLADRHRVMAGWVAAAVVVTLATVVSIWIVPLTVAVRIAAAADGFRRSRAAARAGLRPDWIAGFIVIGIHVVVFLGIRVFALEAFKIPASSMTPTLVVGDHLFLNKLSMHWRRAERGDVIVFKQPCEPDR